MPIIFKIGILNKIAQYLQYRMTNKQRDSNKDYSPPVITSRGIISNHCMVISTEKGKKTFAWCTIFSTMQSFDNRYQMNVHVV